MASHTFHISPMLAKNEDFLFFQAGVAELQDYLLSDGLYWQLSTTDIFVPRLSIGLLLLTRKRLEAWVDSLSVLAGLDAQMEAIRAQWRSTWEQKVTREIHARIDLWRNYLLDYRENPVRQADVYPHEVRWRVILHLLSGESPDAPGLVTLDDLDEVLKIYFQSGDFIWEADLNYIFLKDPFWYLYGKLRSEEKND